MNHDWPTIRHATVADVPAISRVHVDTSRATYAGIFPAEHIATMTYDRREAAWREIVANDQLVTIVSVAGDNVIGFVNGGGRREGPSSYTGELYALYVLPTRHRQGVGRLLVRAFVKALAVRGHESMLVWVLRDNSACGFYERLGGIPVAATTITRAGKQLEEVAYGWTDASRVLAS